MSTSRNELPVLEGMKGSLVREPPKNREDEIRLSLMGLAALFSYLGFWRGFSSIDFVAIGATLVGGYPVFVETFHSLRHRSINMEVSMTVAIVASLLVGQFTAAVVVTFFVLLSEFIEAYAVDKGRATIVKLEKSIPRRALVRRNGKEVEAEVETIQLGETVIVRDGERIPVDGALVKGSGFVNQSAITGEAIAVEKMVGSRVFAGSVDESGIFEVRTEKVGTETVFGQIIKLVEEAESRKAPIQRISDKLAAWLVEFTIIFAVITFLVTWNLISTISVIVVAGACGVAAGTPLAIVAVMGGLAKRGVIVKGGVYVQEMSKVDTVVIDKTGTLTFGDPEVTDVVALDGCSTEQVLASLLGSSLYPNAKGQFVGMVCLTPPLASACPAPPVSVTGSIGSQLMVPVIVQGSDVFNGFDITLKTNHTILTPTGVSLADSLLASGSILLECVGVVLKVGPNCSPTDTSDTLHMALVGPLQEFAPLTGLLFTAIFNITGNADTTIGYQTGCSQSSVNNTSICMLFSNGSLSIPPETIQDATYAVAPTPTFTIVSNPGSLTVTKGSVGNTTITATSLNGFTGNITFSLSVNSTARHLPTFSVTPAMVGLTYGGSSMALFNVSAKNNSDRTEYYVTITASGGGISDVLEITVYVII